MSGACNLTEDWSLFLPEKFNRRIEDGDMVIWRPGLTFYLAAWDNDDRQTPQACRDGILREAGADRRNERQTERDDLLVLTYEQEERDARRSPSVWTALSSYTIAPIGHLQLSAYCDTDADLAVAYAVVGSVALI